MKHEQATRNVLAWAMKESPFRIPAEIADAAKWKFDEDDVSLSRMHDAGQFKFFVSLVRNGARRRRIAVLTIEDDNGTAKWESVIPSEDEP